MQALWGYPFRSVGAVVSVPLLILAVLVSRGADAADGDAENYAALRLQFAHQPGYDATALVMKENALSREAHQLWNTGHGEETVAKIQEMLQQYPLSLLANLMMAETCRKLAEHTDSDVRKGELLKLSTEHQDRYNLLVQSITRSSQCSTPQDRCTVINISEEYLVLHEMRLQRKSQALTLQNGEPYDVLVGSSADGIEKTLYFDISPFFDMKPFNEMGRSQGSTDPSPKAPERP